jgi:hypothetical protein
MLSAKRDGRIMANLLQCYNSCWSITSFLTRHQKLNRNKTRQRVKYKQYPSLTSGHFVFSTIVLLPQRSLWIVISGSVISTTGVLNPYASGTELITLHEV